MKNNKKYLTRVRITGTDFVKWVQRAFFGGILFGVAIVGVGIMVGTMFDK